LKALAVSDLHGLETRFALIGRLLDGGIDSLLIAGDIAASGNPDVQQADVRRNFGTLLEGRRGVRIFAIPGNDDWAIVGTALREFPEITVPTDRAYPLAAGISIIGYPFVPITPFLMKDFEKWDKESEPVIPSNPAEIEAALVVHRLNIQGFRSRGADVYDYTFDPGDREDNIGRDLERIARFSDPRETLYLFHCPPHGILDGGISVGPSVHIGSKAVRAFIEERRPRLTVHGHSHEAVDLAGGAFEFSLGSSKGLAVGPGNDPEVLNYLLVDLENGIYARRRISLHRESVG
jgi:Icc-related predicted phosphoesterase